MAKKRDKTPVVYTAEERRKFLFRTAAEMRVINEKADKRSKNKASREEQEFSVDTEPR